jgi:xanthine dehydrogenase accessory factor
LPIATFDDVLWFIIWLLNAVSSKALMHLASLVRFFSVRRDRQVPLALATVVHTQGSTYSKAGAMMLIDEHGIFQGMLSGGCLEGDLAIRAQQVIESQSPQVVSYDLAMDNEELWGLGVGCDGLMKVLLQPLLPQERYEPLASILDVVSHDRSAEIAIVIESADDAVPLASCTVRSVESSWSFGTDVDLSKTHSAHRVLRTLVRPPPRVLVLGAGLDAEPVIRFASEMGWRCTVADHRPGYFEKADFSAAAATVCSDVDSMAAKLDPDNFDAAIIMSHHLASDRAYLRMLADSQVGYIGLLGPPGRRDRLLAEIDSCAEKLTDRLHGPAGIELGGRGPAAIALSIVAGVQAYLGEQAD